MYNISFALGNGEPRRFNVKGGRKMLKNLLDNKDIRETILRNLTEGGKIVSMSFIRKIPKYANYAYDMETMSDDPDEEMLERAAKFDKYIHMTRYKEPFTKEQWEEFKEIVRYYKGVGQDLKDFGWPS